MKLVATVLGLAGCNQVFGVEQTDLAPISDAAIDCGVLPGHPSFHDEDDDDYADLCDNCLGMPNQDQADTDGDLIGDVCDPQPGRMDSVLAQFTFEDPATASDWLVAKGNWRIENDAYLSTVTSDPNNEHDVLYQPMVWAAPIALEAHVTFDDIGSATLTTYRFAIEVLTASSGVSGAECQVARRWETTMHADQVRAYSRVNGSSALPLDPSMLANGAGYRVRMSLAGRTLLCRVDGDAGDSAAITQNLASELTGSDHVGMFTQTAAARVQYLVVYRLGT